MGEKPKFFFEADSAGGDEYSLTSQEHAETFFSTLQTAGILKDTPIGGLDLEEQKVEVDASMKKQESKVLLMEYGTYQENYAIHLTPIHPVKNLESEQQVRLAMYKLASILNEYISRDVHVDLYLPRADWKMKVLSAKVREGASVWGFDRNKFESEGLPRIFEAVEKVILG